MKIIELSSQNILRLDAVEITPEGNLIIVGGENAQGKTSVLDSILLAMGGKKAKHQEPLKQGKKKGKIVINVGNFTVTRIFTQKGGSLKVVNNNDQKVYSSPQKMLDELVGQLTFDPLIWSGMQDKQQMETLKALVGLDFMELDAKRAELYTERTDLNRDAKRVKGLVDSAEEHDDVPLVEVSVSELVDELNKAQAIIYSRDSDEIEICRLKDAYKEKKADIEEWQGLIAGLQKKINEATSTMEDLKSKGQSLQEKLDSTPAPGINLIQKQIDSAEDTNHKIRSNSALHDNKKLLKNIEKKASDLTDQISSIDEQKASQLSNAKFPVAGLSFDEDGVLYQGVPFAQASSAEKLRVSVAMGIALNPDLKVLLIRDGSLLDDNNLKVIAEMADKSGHQIWLERVGKGKECSVIIEDGMVKYDKNKE